MGSDMGNGTLWLLRRLMMIVGLVLWSVAAASADGAVATAPAATVAVDPTAQLSGLDPAAVKALVAVLKNDAARAVLIDSLEKLPAEPAAVAEPAPVEPAATPGLPLARELGSVTEQLSRQTVDVASKIGYGLSNLWRLFDGSVVISWDSLRDHGLSLVLLIVFATAVFIILRRLSSYPLAVLCRLADGRPRLKRLPFVAAALVVRLFVIGLSWFLTFGYALLSSEGGRIEYLGGQFIDAFVLIETMRALLAVVFEHRRASLNPFDIGQATALFWYRRLARLVSFVGYGVLVAYPIVNRLAGFSVGIGFRLAVVIVGLVAAIALVVRTRDKVRAGLSPSIDRFNNGLARAALALLVHAWHVVAIAYLLVAFAIWVSRPFDAIDFMAVATLETVVVIAVGGLLVNLLSQAVAGGIRLPAEARLLLPLLEPRLNLFVPMLLGAVRVVVVVLGLAAILQVWGIIDVAAWFESARGTDLIGRALSAFVMTAVALAVWLAASSWIEYRLNPTLGRVTNARTRTLLSLFRNAFSILLVVIATMLVLSQLGIDIAPLVAGAGVVGLAVGFGSQKLVQDIITGAFIQLENAMNEGDVVTVAGVSGVVDRLTIRSVAIRDGDGVYHIIPFSSVGSVSNAMRGFSFHTANLDVGYSENVEAVKSAMRAAFDALMQTERGRVVLEPLELQGIVQFGLNSMTFRARIKTLPGEQWATGRLYNELVKREFDLRGIRAPQPQATVLVTGDDPFGKHADARSERSTD